MFNFASDNGYIDTTAMNIYVTSWNQGFGNAAEDVPSNQFVVKVASLDDSGMIHEMGHSLSLRHTRSGNEHVTRDPNDPTGNFNALSTADRILDTAANPGFLIDGEYPWILDGCIYDPDSPELDQSFPIQRRYRDEITHEDVINTMSNAYVCNNTGYLSPGQGIYMRETIEQDAQLMATLTDVPALFKPYAGEYYFAGPFDPSVHRPLFQPGFNYSFIECDGNYPQPADFYDISYTVNNNNVLLSINENDTNYASMVHPNHSAIHIEQLDNYNNVNNDYDFPRKCYNNFNQNPIGGTVIKFNDGVLNANITVTPQDSTAINNPNLILNLETGLYKIEKTYNDGEVEENLILKENN